MLLRKNYSYLGLLALFANFYTTSYTLRPIPRFALDFQISAEDYLYTHLLLPYFMLQATFLALVACVMSGFVLCLHGDMDRPNMIASSLRPNFFRCQKGCADLI